MQAKPPSSLSPLTLEVLAIMATGKRVNSDDDDGSGGIGGDNGGGGGGGGGGGRYADSGDGSTDGSDVEYIDSSTLVPGSIGGGGGGDASAGDGAGAGAGVGVGVGADGEGDAYEYDAGTMVVDDTGTW